MCVAQLDRASDYGSEGREFESSRTHYFMGMYDGTFFFCVIDKMIEVNKMIGGNTKFEMSDEDNIE